MRLIFYNQKVFHTKVTNIPELKLPPVTRIKPSVDVVKESTEAAKKLNKGSGSFDFLKKFKIPGLSQGRLGRIGLGLDVMTEHRF